MAQVNFMNQRQPQGPRRPQGNQMDPDNYARMYAKQNGITLEEAKDELKAKYGDPTQPNQNEGLFEGNEEENNLQSFSFADFKDFDSINTNSVNSEASIKLIKSMLMQILDFLKSGNGPQNEGDPVKNNDMVKEAETSGKKERLPKSKAERDKYAQQYANEHGITLAKAKEILASKEPTEKIDE